MPSERFSFHSFSSRFLLMFCLLIHNALTECPKTVRSLKFIGGCSRARVTPRPAFPGAGKLDLFWLLVRVYVHLRLADGFSGKVLGQRPAACRGANQAWLPLVQPIHFGIPLAA